MTIKNSIHSNFDMTNEEMAELATMNLKYTVKLDLEDPRKIAAFNAARELWAEINRRNEAIRGR